METTRGAEGIFAVEVLVGAQACAECWVDTCGSRACLRGWAEVYWGDVLDARKVLRAARNGVLSVPYQWPKKLRELSTRLARRAA